MSQRTFKSFLQNQRLEAMEYTPAKRPLSITPAPEGSGQSDVSVNHDQYLAEMPHS